MEAYELHILNTLILDCLNSHAPLKRCKITRPPAPWLKSFDFSELKAERDEKRYQAHQTQSVDDWNQFATIKNKIKRKIKEQNGNFTKLHLALRNPKMYGKPSIES